MGKAAAEPNPLFMDMTQVSGPAVTKAESTGNIAQ